MEPTAITKKEQSLKPLKQMSESGQQFHDIYEKFYSPEERDKRKILENRKKRAENIKKDLGI